MCVLRTLQHTDWRGTEFKEITVVSLEQELYPLCYISALLNWMEPIKPSSTNKIFFLLEVRFVHVFFFLITIQYGDIEQITISDDKTHFVCDISCWFQEVAFKHTKLKSKICEVKFSADNTMLFIASFDSMCCYRLSWHCNHHFPL